MPTQSDDTVWPYILELPGRCCVSRAPLNDYLKRGRRPIFSPRDPVAYLPKVFRNKGLGLLRCELSRSTAGHLGARG